LQIQPEEFETVLCAIGFEPAQRLGEPGEGREYLDPGVISSALTDETSSGFRRPVAQYIRPV
jgi:hypothetical protein